VVPTHAEMTDGDHHRDICIVIPTYDEAENIIPLIDAVRRELPEARILVVDDSSPDGTADLVERRAESDANVAVLRRGTKSGLGAAYRAGFTQAIDSGASICVQMDADLSHDPRYLPELVSAVRWGPTWRSEVATSRAEPV